MQPFSVDPEWVRIDSESTTDGDPTRPLWAKNVRSPGMMITGRIVRTAGMTFTAEVYRKGQWQKLDQHDEFSAAVMQVVNPPQEKQELAR